MRTKIFRSKKYLQFIQNQPCVICGSVPSDPHHIEAGGMGIKTDDTRVISLCRKHHSEVHATGKKSFQVKYSLDMWKTAFLLLEKYMKENKTEP